MRFSEAQGRLSCRFNRRFIEVAAERNGAPYAGEVLRMLDLFDEIAARPDLAYRMMLEPENMQFVNNYILLHAREGYEDWPEADRKRYLLRLWLEVEGTASRCGRVRDALRCHPLWRTWPIRIGSGHSVKQFVAASHAPDTGDA